MESQKAAAAGDHVPGLFANLPRNPSWIREGSPDGHDLMLGDSAPKRKGYLTPNPLRLGRGEDRTVRKSQHCQ